MFKLKLLSRLKSLFKSRSLFKPKPLFNWIVILPGVLKDGTTPSGLIIPQTERGVDVKTGEVIQIGKGYEGIPPQVKKGEVVMFSKREGLEFEYKGKIYLLIQEGKLLMVV